MEQAAEPVSSSEGRWPAAHKRHNPAARIWNIEVECSMWTRAVVMIDVDAKHPLEVAATEDQESVQAFTTDRAHEALGVSVGVRRSDGRSDDAHALSEAARFRETGRTSVIRSNLIDKGLIFSPKYGLVDFTVPRFGEFMRRNFPSSGAPAVGT